MVSNEQMIPSGDSKRGRPETEALRPVEMPPGRTRESAHQTRRHELRDLVKASLGKDRLFIGTSAALRSVETFVEKAAPFDLPVLIIGEIGSEKAHVAYALHVGGPRRGHPFVEVHGPAYAASTFKTELYERFRQADQGTIFLKGIDELDYTLQCQLAEIIDAVATPHTRPAPWNQLGDVRIVASASKDPDRLIEEDRFCPLLLGKIDFLKIQIAPLRERKEDVKPLVEYFLKRYAGPLKRRLSETVLQLCEAYRWPRNVDEVERVIACLAVLSEDETITMRDVRAHAPNLVQHGPEAALRDLAAGTPSGNGSIQGAQRRKIDQVDARLVSLAHALIQGELADLERLHPGLQKALEHIAGNFQEPISLHQLARHACVSPSHLSYLFKKALGVSFKPFLALVRIKKAAHLLIEQPYQGITEVALEVGFGDLRHFERTFKRLLACSPRVYRQNALAQGPAAALPFGYAGAPGRIRESTA